MLPLKPDYLSAIFQWIVDTGAQPVVCLDPRFLDSLEMDLTEHQVTAAPSRSPKRSPEFRLDPEKLPLMVAVTQTTKLLLIGHDNERIELTVPLPAILGVYDDDSGQGHVFSEALAPAEEGRVLADPKAVNKPRNRLRLVQTRK